MPEVEHEFYSRSEMLNGQLVWAIYEGNESQGFRGKFPIAYFKDEEEARDFVFGNQNSRTFNSRVVAEEIADYVEDETIGIGIVGAKGRKAIEAIIDRHLGGK